MDRRTHLASDRILFLHSFRLAATIGNTLCWLLENTCQVSLIRNVVAATIFHAEKRRQGEHLGDANRWSGGCIKD